MTTLQKTLIAVTIAAALGTVFYEAKQAARARAEAQTLQQQQAPLREQIAQLQAERDKATNRIARLNDQLSQRARNDLELLRLRGEANRLRHQAQPASNPQRATGDEEESGLGDVNNARGVALDGGATLNFTNGVAVILDPDPDLADSATARSEYRIVRLLASDGHYDCCVMNLNGGGSGDFISFGIFTKDDAQAVKSLQMLDVGDRVQIYHADQDQAGTLSVYYLDRPEGVAMAEAPNLPKRSTFKLDPATGKFIKDTTFVLDVKQPWKAEPPTPDAGETP